MPSDEAKEAFDRLKKADPETAKLLDQLIKKTCVNEDNVDHYELTTGLDFHTKTYVHSYILNGPKVNKTRCENPDRNLHQVAVDPQEVNCEIFNNKKWVDKMKLYRELANNDPDGPFRYLNEVSPGGEPATPANFGTTGRAESSTARPSNGKVRPFKKMMHQAQEAGVGSPQPSKSPGVVQTASVCTSPSHSSSSSLGDSMCTSAPPEP